MSLQISWLDKWLDDRHACKSEAEKHPVILDLLHIELLKAKRPDNVKVDDSFLHVRICIHPRVVL